MTGCIGIGWTRTFSFFFPPFALGRSTSEEVSRSPTCSEIGAIHRVQREEVGVSSGAGVEWSVCRANTNRVGGGRKKTADTTSPPPFFFPLSYVVCLRPTGEEDLWHYNKRT